MRALPSRIAIIILTLGVFASPAAAQELLTSNVLANAVLFPAAPVAPAADATPARVSVAAEQGPAVNAVIARPDFSPRRPSLLPALYIGQIALQALDAHSTFTALDRGGVEANPLMKGVAGNRGAMLAVKAGAAAGTIWAAEHLWRRGNRAGAIALMVVANGVTAAVVAHNYKVASALR